MNHLDRINQFTGAADPRSVAEAAGRAVINEARPRGPRIGEPSRSGTLRVAVMYKVADSPSTSEQVRERTLAALAEKARLMLDEGVVAEPQDIDLCMITAPGGRSTSAASRHTSTAVASRKG
jgi:hypothetical protein